ncbi:hypothetical protein KM043_010629 [Ampulex compressa]|nr:hypothetical protein KM043_010629 [Ampulex compressa]
MIKKVFERNSLRKNKPSALLRAAVREGESVEKDSFREEGERTYRYIIPTSKVKAVVSAREDTSTFGKAEKAFAWDRDVETKSGGNRRPGTLAEEIVNVAFTTLRDRTPMAARFSWIKEKVPPIMTALYSFFSDSQSRSSRSFYFEPTVPRFRPYANVFAPESSSATPPLIHVNPASLPKGANFASPMGDT